MRKKTSENARPAPLPPAYVGLTPNQVVAFNLAEAREWKGWTQQQLAEALEPYLGKRWSKASVSQAERSLAGKFIRQFDADELVALARAFDLPIGWFFMPPPPWADTATPVRLSTPDAKQFGTALAELVDLVFGDQPGQALLELRLQAFLDQLGPTGPLSQKQDTVANLVTAKIEALAHHRLADLERWQTQLRGMANQLEDLQSRAQRQLAGEVDTTDT
jgi:transcriptional regulator with XRE-family HTH domain